jgi:hypothetical protein
VTPKLLAARRELVLARVALQRARLVREVAAVRTAAVWPIASMLSSRAAAALVQTTGAGTAAAPRRRLAWLEWAAIALQVMRIVQALRQPR